MPIFPTSFISSPRKKIILSALSLCVLMLVLLVAWQGVKIWSYTKLTPYKVSFMVLSQNDIVLNVQYDYGYGFVQGHVRPIVITAEDDFQKVAMSISAWKQVKNLRFSSPNNPEDIRVKLLNVSLLGRNVLSQSKITLASQKMGSAAATFESEASVNLPFIVQNLGH